MATAKITPYWYAPGTSNVMTSMLPGGGTEPFTPPAAIHTYFGAYVQRNTGAGENWTQATARFNTAMSVSAPGTVMEVCRIFDDGGLGLADAVIGLNQVEAGPNAADGYVVSFSYSKLWTSIADVTAGVYDSDINSGLASLKALTRHPKIWLCFVHEMDADISNGLYTVAQFAAAWNHVMGLVAAAAVPNLRRNPIFTGYLFSTRLPPIWAAIDTSTVDCIGLDIYTHTAGQTASALYSTPLGIINALTPKPGWACAETAFPGNPGDTNNNSYIQSFKAMFDGSAEYVTWFNDQSLGDEIDQLPNSIASYANLVNHV